MSTDSLEICSPIFEVKAGRILDMTLPLIDFHLLVPPIDIILFNPFCIGANAVFKMLMSLGDKWAREYYEAEE